MTTARPEAGSWNGGWLGGARAVVSPNANERPDGAVVDLLVLHSISLPPGRYGGPEVEQLFTNQLDWSADPYFEQIRGMEVSAHFFVRRDGELIQFVDADRRAWHAGISKAWKVRPSRMSNTARCAGCACSWLPATRLRMWRVTSTSRRTENSTPAPASTGCGCRTTWDGVLGVFPSA